jgi:hypothetical protein
MVRQLQRLDRDKPAIAASPSLLFAGRHSQKIGFDGNQEPPLAELLIDPIVHRLMASDGVRQDHLIDLIADVAVKLAWRRGHV